MAGRQTQRGKAAQRQARKILRADQRQAPRLDYDRVRTRPGKRELTDTRTLT
jgi:hypothetical protein